MILINFKLTGEMLVPARGYTLCTNVIRGAGRFDTDTTGSPDFDFTCEIDNKDSEFRFGTTDVQIGGDSMPIESITPKYSGKALKGYTAVWYGIKGDALAWGQQNLANYEFIQNATHMLIWGELNTSKTEDYDPFATVTGAYCFNEAYDGL